MKNQFVTFLIENHKIQENLRIENLELKGKLFWADQNLKMLLENLDGLREELGKIKNDGRIGAKEILRKKRKTQGTEQKKC